MSSGVVVMSSEYWASLDPSILVTIWVTGMDNKRKLINPYSLYPLELTRKCPVSAYPEILASPADLVFGPYLKLMRYGINIDFWQSGHHSILTGFSNWHPSRNANSVTAVLVLPGISVNRKVLPGSPADDSGHVASRGLRNRHRYKILVACSGGFAKGKTI